MGLRKLSVLAEGVAGAAGVAGVAGRELLFSPTVAVPLPGKKLDMKLAMVNCLP